MDYNHTGPILPASLVEPGQDADVISVLYIEDEDHCYQLVNQYLSASNGESQSNGTILPFRVFHAVSLEDGLRCLRDARADREIDCILLDLDLPESSAENTFHTVYEENRKIPIVILSAENDPGIALNLVKKGAQDFLPKTLLEFPESIARSLYSAVERNRILREKSSLQTQLIQAEKLDSLGRIAAGVAHEVKNPLAIIQMGIAYLNSRLSEIEETKSAELQGACREVQEAANRAVKIIGGMVDFSRDDSVSLVRSDVNRAVGQSLELLKYEITKNSIVVESELGEDLPPVLLDESKIQQVLMNLVRNSIQAMDDNGGKGIQIRTFSRPIAELRNIAALESMIGSSKEGEIVTIEIRDEGPGIPEELISQIFEPFFTTKPKGKGSGLGMSVVFHIIDLHNGFIRVKNRTDRSGLRTRIHFKAMCQ